MSKNNPYKLRKSDLKKVNMFDQKDTPDGMYRQQVEDFNRLNLGEFEIAEQERTGETTNPWDQGRNCPYCAGRLVTAEWKEDAHLLTCTSCGSRFYEQDLNVQDETADKIYRTISDRTFQKWERFMSERK